jgi:hypothetical protein
VIRASEAEYRNQLTAHYLKSLDYRGNTEVLDFAFARGDPHRAATVAIARMRLPCEDGSDLWFAGSLGHRGATYVGDSDHRHQFVGIFDMEDLALCEMVASTYHFDEFVERLNYGHTFPLGKGSALRLRGYSAAIALESRLYQHFEDDECLISGIPTRLFSVVPITGADLELKKSRGLDALLESWRASNRDLLHVGSTLAG